MDRPEEQEKTTPVGNRKDLIWGLPRTVACFVVIALTSAIVYRLVTVHCDLQFDFPAFLSLLLALFAVGLSALFYFKTTEISNAFYDNTHKFTREVSQILGRIEAGFGERLRHLDEGYTGLRDRFEKLPFDVSKAREQEEEEKQEVARKEAEIQDLLNNLAERAQLAETEKRELFARLEQTQEELAMSKSELRRLQRRIRSAEEEPSEVHPGFSDYLRSFLQEHSSLRLTHRYPSLIIKREFRKVSEALDPAARDFMQRHDLLDEEGDLTGDGVRFVGSIMRKIRSNN